MIIGIYKITSPSGSINIGQSWNIEKRWKDYKGYHCKGQPKLYNSLLKYGSKNHKFEVIHEVSDKISQEELDNLECFYILQYKEIGFTLLNIREGGSRGKHSEDSKRKINERSLRGSNNPNSIKIYQYDLKGNFIKEWDSIIEVTNKRGYEYISIIRCARECKFKVLNSQWRYFKKDSIDPYKDRRLDKHPRVKNIKQLSKDGNLIEVFSTISDIIDKYGFDRSNICKAIKNKKLYNNYNWTI